MMTPKVVALTIALAISSTTAPRSAELPLFDAHIHYSRPDWTVIPPDRALGMLSAASITRALVSSTPDDGTLTLYDKSPTRIVPFLRPYRSPSDMRSWPRDPGVQAYVETRLQRGIYKGIGEFHLSAPDADAPVVKRFAEVGARHALFLHAHVDDETVERLLTLYPGARVLWAHAGMSSPPSTVGRLLDRFPHLWVELALRSDVAPGGSLDPAWLALFTRHPDRFMVGTDTWTTSRWDTLVAGMREVQGWLGQLSQEIAEKIAYRNGDRLFPRP